MVKKNENGDRILILGAGIAGVTAAQHAREHAPNAAISLVSKESDRPYYRLNLSRYLAGEIPREALDLESETWYSERNIEWIVGEAASIDRENKHVDLRDGQKLPYDRLILANGAHSFVPPIAGATKAGVVVFRTLAETQDILTRLDKHSPCVCVGGGLLGLETAGALAKRGLSVTVLEGFDWLLPRQLAEPAGRMVAKYLESISITIKCSVKVEEFVGDEQVRGIRLGDGQEVKADLVVLSTGVRPNSYLGRLSGLDVHHGIVVDDQMKTSDSAIFAAGDEHRGGR